MLLLGRTKERPMNFRMNPNSPLYGGLVFAGLGGRNCAWTSRYADSSPYGNHGTLTNMDPATDWVWDSELGRQVISTPGANDYVSSGAFLPSSGNWSISAWGNLANNGRYLVVDDVSPTNLLIQYVVNARVEFYFATGVASWTSPSQGVWYNFVGMSGGTFGRLYVDAVQQGVTIAKTWAGLSGNLTLANRTAVDRAWLGKFTDVGIWHRMLSECEMASIADRSNVLLRVGGSDLIQGYRTIWPGYVAGAPPSVARFPWQQRRHRRMAGAR